MTTQRPNSSPSENDRESQAGGQAIPFRCPHCGLQTAVAPSFAGQTGPCAGCGKLVTVPVPTVAAPPAPGRPTGLPRWLRLSLAASIALLCLVAIAVIVGGLVRPALVASRNSAREYRCRVRLQTLTSALLAYERDHGHLPPAYVADQNGRPLLSWRVLLLPYLGPESAAIHARLHLDQPWNSPANAQLNPWCPDVFTCDADQPFAVGDTSYCAVTGFNYAMFRDQPRQLSAVRDPPQETLVLVEVANSGINWMEPRDLGEQQLVRGISAAAQGQCGSLHASGATLGGFLDGQVRDLAELDGGDLHALATIAGAEDVSFLSDR